MFDPKLHTGNNAYTSLYSLKPRQSAPWHIKIFMSEFNCPPASIALIISTMAWPS